MVSAFAAERFQLSMNPSMNYSNSLDISAIGNRSRRGPDDANQQYNRHKDKLPGYQLLEATEWALDDLLEGSRFFRANPPRNIPEFASHGKRMDDLY